MKKIIAILFPLFFIFKTFAQDIFIAENTDLQTVSDEIFGRWKLKNLENSFKKFNENLYIAETEVTNEQYGYFLADLLLQKKYDELQLVKAEKVDWKSLLAPGLQKYSDDIIYKHGHPDEPVFPAQNMSYEGAKAFCEWLTKFYTNEDQNKRKWKKVEFRLPTEAEWMLAARGGKESNALYPWAHSSPKNGKGCYLSNYNCINEEPCPTCPSNEARILDGGVFSVRADAYYPNSLTLYCMSGNVAEMIATKGIAKGGSWEDEPSKCTIPFQKKYDKPSPAIGFRVLMEILE